MDLHQSYILTENSGKTSGFLMNSSKNFANDLVLLSASKELSQWITKGCQWFIILAKGEILYSGTLPYNHPVSLVKSDTWTNKNLQSLNNKFIRLLHDKHLTYAYRSYATVQFVHHPLFFTYLKKLFLFCILPGISCFGLWSSCEQDSRWGINYRMAIASMNWLKCNVYMASSCLI